MNQPNPTLRFVIQEHTYSGQMHWDLMLESGPALATWQVAVPPGNWPGETVTCRKLADHRLDYLTYQGPLSRDRGQVRIKALGHYEPIRIEGDCWQVALAGQTITGQLDLRLVEGDQWQLSFSASQPKIGEH